MALTKWRFTSYSHKYSTDQTIICCEALPALHRLGGMGGEGGREEGVGVTIYTAERRVRTG